MRSLGMIWITMLVLSACSQEDPGTDNETAGTGGSGGRAGSGDAGGGDAGGGSGGRAGSGDAGGGDAGGGAVAKDYYPMVAESTLVYRKSNGGSASADEQTTVSALEYDGKAAFATEGAPDSSGESSKNIIQQIGTRIHRVHKEERRGATLLGTVDYEPGFLRFDQAWVGAAAGTAENVSYMRIEKTAQGMASPGDSREHTFTVEAPQESVTVVAGTFDDCIKVRRVRIRGNASSSSDDDDKVFWFCAGIGKVKELSEMSGDVEELVSCDIPGGSCP